MEDELDLNEGVDPGFLELERPSRLQEMMKKRIPVFGKNIPMLVLVVGFIFLASAVTATVLTVLSNPVKVSVSVETPLSTCISDDFSTSIANCHDSFNSTAYGGETLKYTIVVANEADAIINGRIENRLNQTDNTLNGTEIQQILTRTYKEESETWIPNLNKSDCEAQGYVWDNTTNACYIEVPFHKEGNSLVWNMTSSSANGDTEYHWVAIKLNPTATGNFDISTNIYPQAE